MILFQSEDLDDPCFYDAGNSWNTWWKSAFGRRLSEPGEWHGKLPQTSYCCCGCGSEVRNNLKWFKLECSFHIRTKRSGGVSLSFVATECVDDRVSRKIYDEDAFSCLNHLAWPAAKTPATNASFFCLMLTSWSCLLRHCLAYRQMALIPSLGISRYRCFITGCSQELSQVSCHYYSSTLFHVFKTKY